MGAALAAASLTGLLAPQLATPAGSTTPLVGISMPNKAAIVAPEQAGKIVALPFVEGDQVAKDAPIFRLNSRLEELEVERLRAIVESDLARQKAAVSLRQAMRQEQRLRDLCAQKIASEADLENQIDEVEIERLRLEQAELETDQARNQLAQAEERLSQRAVKSPFDGVVTQLFKSEGESVERFAPVIEVMNLDPLWVEFDCPVQDKGRYRVGGTVIVTPAFAKDETRQGKVVHISLKADASSHTLGIRVEVPNRNLTWNTGQKMLISMPEAADVAAPGK